MSREAAYLESLRRLRLPTLRSYLESRGWTRAADYKGNLAIFTRGTGSLQQLLVPIHPEFDDFADQMGQVLRKLAESEGRSERSVLHDLYASQMDTLRYRVQSPAASRGTLPLEQGISLLEGAKRSLLAAACSVLSPERTYHPRMSLSPAEDFVDTCELAQTEEGSFAIVLRCPLQFADNESLATNVPFARRATDTLFASVSALVCAIDGDRVDSIIRNPSPSSARLTANLCDALIRMQPESEDASVELSVSWATVLPNPKATPNSVTIRGELFPKIAEVSKHLRPAAVQSARFLARIDVLCGAEVDELGRRYGEVKLSVVLGDEVVRARAMLDAEKYKVADEAHMQNRYVVIKGVVNRTSRLAAVSDVTDFQLTSDQLLVFPATHHE